MITHDDLPLFVYHVLGANTFIRTSSNMVWTEGVPGLDESPENGPLIDDKTSWFTD